MIQGYAQTYDWWLQEQSAKLINHPITHQGFIDMGFKVFMSPNGEFMVYDKLDYGRVWVEYRSGCGFILRYHHAPSINDFHRITHESQLRQLYLNYTGFQL